MKMQALMCHQCGAPLDVPACQDIVTCLYCSANVYLEKTPPAESSTKRAPSRPRSALREVAPEIARLLNELEQLDREWFDYRSQYLLREDNGAYSVPDEKSYSWGAGIVGALGVPLLAWTYSRGESWWVLLVETAIIALVVLGCLGSAKLARVYRRSLRNYTHERTKLTQQLRERGWDETNW